MVACVKGLGHQVVGLYWLSSWLESGSGRKERGMEGLCWSPASGRFYEWWDVGVLWVGAPFHLLSRSF